MIFSWYDRQCRKVSTTYAPCYAHSCACVGSSGPGFDTKWHRSNCEHQPNIMFFISPNFLSSFTTSSDIFARMTWRNFWQLRRNSQSNSEGCQNQMFCFTSLCVFCQHDSCFLCCIAEPTRRPRHTWISGSHDPAQQTTAVDTPCSAPTFSIFSQWFCVWHLIWFSGCTASFTQALTIIFWQHDTGYGWRNEFTHTHNLDIWKDIECMSSVMTRQRVGGWMALPVHLTMYLSAYVFTVSVYLPLRLYALIAI